VNNRALSAVSFRRAAGPLFFLRFWKGCCGGDLVNTILRSKFHTLTDFRKNASFRPDMLNHLNTTFTFGKQTKNNFIYRKVQCRPTYSFIHSFLCSLFLWGVAGAAALCGPETPDDQQNFRYFCWLPHLRGTKQGRRCSYATWSLDELWAAFPWV